MPASISPDLALVPEHSRPLMEAMSGGHMFTAGAYAFCAAEDWLMAIAWPLRGRYSDESFLKSLEEARGRTGADTIFMAGPAIPESLSAHVVERDRTYVLSARAPVPARLLNPVRKAATRLRVSEGREFTADHRRLWAEFTETRGKGMKERVAALYAATPRAMARAGGSLRLLDARNDRGDLVASLLLDYWPAHFTSYIIGAHSRRHYEPHAVDLLFASMLARAREAGKSFIHLGLGVNEGILRFKLKWGARPALPYVMAQWEESGAREEREQSMGTSLALAILHSSATDPARLRAEILNAPERKPYAMLWRLEKNGRVSWLGGTAHFFCHSFEPSFRKLFRNVDNVIFEGPLDADFLAEVDRAGKKAEAGATPILDLLNEKEILKLERTVLGSRFAGARKRAHDPDIRWLLRHARPWNAFFSIWTAFLENLGWGESVDMEAWRIAGKMGKNIIAMENMEEQLESLDSLPVERVLNFFRDCGSWKRRARINRSAYLAGDLERMMGSSAEFPTRTEHVVGRRDQRFRERMRPYLEAGGAAVFVGSAHLVNLRHMLAEDGFQVRQTPFGLWPKLHLGWRNLARPDGKMTWLHPSRK